MNREALQNIVNNISYTRHGNTWHLKLGYDDKRPYLQIVCDQSEDGPWSGRKWMLSPFMTVTEVVSTAFVAFLAAEEHETREFFKYKDVPVFGPHFDVEHLVNMIQAKTVDVDVRTDAMQGTRESVIQT